MAKKKVLITGANGFLGSNLTKYLSADDRYEVYAMVRPAGTVNFLHEFQKDPTTGENLFELVEANLTSDSDVEKAAAGMDVIIHLAGLVTDWGEEERYYDLNVEGTKRVLRAATKGGASKVIYLSSLTVHSMKGHHYSDEETPADMRNFPYGETKKIGEDLVNQWEGESAVVRPGWVIYGPYDKNTFTNVLDAIKAGQFGYINGGRKLVSYVYVENLCYGIEKLISAKGVEGTFNILDGNMPWKEWIGTWAESLHVKTPRLSVPYWFMYPFVSLLVGFYKLFRIKSAPLLTHYRIRIMQKDLAFSNEKSKRVLGYEPPVDLKESLDRTLAFFNR